VVVRDEGPGISEGDQAKLFGEFQKLTARPTAGEKSTGLGLAIVKKIIEAHGGAIEVKSRLGQGAEFSFSLPLDPSSKMPAKRPSAKARVVIGEADDRRRRLMETVLVSMNTEIVGKPGTGEEVVKTFREERPNLLLLGMDIPGQDALASLREIMRDFQNAFVIMLTSNSADDNLRECLTLGAAGYIEKDAGVSEIKRVILKTSAKFRKGGEAVRA
jgi:CheY-like chemotaxis protein